MVDLGFLLITFFVYTATVSTPTVSELYMPHDGQVTRPPNLPNSLALTFLLDDNNKVFYYHGDWEEARRNNEIYETDYAVFSGIGNVIRLKQKAIDISGKFIDGRKGLMLLIKPTFKASYGNIIDALDEVMINGVKKYAIVEPEREELEYIKSKKELG
jgi:biopolymer transport protein ExbD